jgi:hypothetical protein
MMEEMAYSKVSISWGGTRALVCFILRAIDDANVSRLIN